MRPHEHPDPDPSRARRARWSPRLNGGLAVALVALTLCSCDPSIGSCPQVDPECVPGLTIAVNTTAVTLEEGESATVQITITRTGNFIGTVFLSVGGLPAGMTFELSPSFITRVSSRSALTLTNESAVPGTVALAYVHGRDGDDNPSIVVEANSPNITVSVPGAGGACAPWEAVASVPEGRPYRDMDFVGNGLGFVAGGSLSSGPRLLRTLDYGRTWALHPAPAPPPGVHLDHVAFPTASVGFIFASGGTTNQLYRTGDGGLTWGLLPAYPGSQEIRDLYFLTELIGFTLPVNTASIWRTEDGGDTWARVDVPNFGHLMGISSATENRVLIASGAEGGGGLLYSDDRGLSWQPATAPSSEYSFVDFFDGQNGVAGGLFTLAQTTDGGVTWQTTGDPAGGALRAVGARRGGSTAYAVGQGIWETTDGGASWRPFCIAIESLGAVEVTANGSVAVGTGVIYRRD
jgi:photosystem II stability/assembly factor-like uncharacterized protein